MGRIMTRYPSPTRALHQLGRHSSGTPGGPPTWDEYLASVTAVAGLSTAQAGANLQAWFGQLPDAQLRAAGANRMAARLREELEAQLSRTWRGRLALRLNAATHQVRCSWEYWNSSTQRQVRDLAGFWETVALLAASAAIMIGVWAAFLDSLRP